ncbi:hypothetical protein Rsub_03554 [Raphidocelis subcapitata]|uniref:Uncharacterized protein n=1 Tax=Raphidocelis subcapitata TaxID=307507 RepID=A0A2V0NUB9_9CHLO|nr:hypothetical protein Rsub_03554 [Raphidocelis subcapitata]|eukprot:GBF91234.1 hypothetical protein Rsub_03554 [Raphidocelis subcapitata]
MADALAGASVDAVPSPTSHGLHQGPRPRDDQQATAGEGSMGGVDAAAAAADGGAAARGASGSGSGAAEGDGGIVSGPELGALLSASGMPAKIMVRASDAPASEANPYFRAAVLAVDRPGARMQLRYQHAADRAPFLEALTFPAFIVIAPSE